jgi:thiol-disulfide isomerase/thioredoxin
VRIVPCIVVLACMLVGVNGCQLFNKKNSNGEGPFLGSTAGEKPKPAAPTDPLAGGATGISDLDGLLAGRVIDGSGKPADAQIRWVCLDDPKEEEAPIDVAVNQQGYFMIQGLKSGKQYKLITRARSGDKTLEVVTFAKAPNVHLLIAVNDRFALPAEKNNPDKGKKSAGKSAEQPASAQIPAGPPGYPGPGWQQQHGPSALPPAPLFGDKSRITEQDNLVVKPPAVWVPNPLGSPKDTPQGGNNGLAPAVKITPPVPQQPSSTLSVAPAAAPVPSSVLVGKRLENFALYDISLQPWELRKERRGKLMLLDFWKTNCPPCVQAIPTLRILQDKYGPQGLEIVSIAYEDSGTAPEQARRVTGVAQRLQTNYQLLLGGGTKCPLKRDLQVRGYPTLVLVDEQGAMVWRHEGGLDRSGVEDLEFAIKRRLAPN